MSNIFVSSVRYNHIHSAQIQISRVSPVCPKPINGLNTKLARVVNMLQKQDSIVLMPVIMDLHWEEVVQVAAAAAVIPNHLLHLLVLHHPLLHHLVEATRLGRHSVQRLMITIGITKMITTTMIGGKFNLKA